MDRDKWIDLYNQGNSFSTIAKWYGVSPSTVNRHVTPHVVVRPSGGNISFDIDEAIKFYKQGKTLQQVAMLMGRNKSAIHQQFKKAGIDCSIESIDVEVLRHYIDNGYTDVVIGELMNKSPVYISTKRRELGYVHNKFDCTIFDKHMGLPIKEIIREVVCETGMESSYLTSKFHQHTNGQYKRELTSKTELRKLLELNGDNIAELLGKGNTIHHICTQLGLSTYVVRSYITDNLIVYNPKTHRMTDYAHKRLTSARWCKAILCRLNNKGGAPEVMRYLNYGVGIDQILMYFKKLGISITVPMEQYYPQLNDYDWLASQYAIKSYGMIAMELGVSPPIVRDALTRNGIEIKVESRISKQELHLRAQVTSIYNGPLLFNDRSIIAPYELDIVVPSLKIAIEYCGIYWHSELFKDNNYHKRKMDMCLAAGYRLVQIFEDEWTYTPKIVLSKLSSILGIQQQKVYGRKVRVSIPSLDEVNRFLDSNHIQGRDKSSIRYGLYNDEVLVAVMTFKRYKSGGYELNRYASSVRVVGGFSKLLSYFIKQHDATMITTFADLRWSDIRNNVYSSNGFECMHITAPSYQYYNYKSKRLEHRMTYQRKHLPKILGDKYNSDLSAKVNLRNNNYYAIYDCGHVKYIWKRDITSLN